MAVLFGAAAFALAMFLGCLYGNPTTSRNTTGWIIVRGLLIDAIVGFLVWATIVADRSSSMPGFWFLVFTLWAASFLGVFLGLRLVRIARKRKGALGPIQ
jgi:hypothetical protein